MIKSIYKLLLALFLLFMMVSLIIFLDSTMEVRAFKDCTNEACFSAKECVNMFSDNKIKELNESYEKEINDKLKYNDGSL